MARAPAKANGYVLKLLSSDLPILMADSPISLASGLPELMLGKQLNTYVTGWRAQVREKGVGLEGKLSVD